MASLLGGVYSDSDHSDAEDERADQPQQQTSPMAVSPDAADISNTPTPGSVAGAASAAASPVPSAAISRPPSAALSEADRQHDAAINTDESSQLAAVAEGDADMELTEAGAAAAAVPVNVSTDIIDPQYSDLLPPEVDNDITDDNEVSEHCVDSYEVIQQRVASFLRFSTQPGALSYTDNIKGRSDFSNPALLNRICDHYKIDDKQSNYPHELYNPRGYDLSDYYDNIAADSRRAQREREAAATARPAQLPPVPLMQPTAAAAGASTGGVAKKARANKWGSANSAITTTSSSSGTGTADSSSISASTASMSSAADIGAGAVAKAKAMAIVAEMNARLAGGVPPQQQQR
jgi:HCNGP-like protein